MLLKLSFMFVVFFFLETEKIKPPMLWPNIRCSRCGRIVEQDQKFLLTEPHMNSLYCEGKQTKTYLDL